MEYFEIDEDDAVEYAVSYTYRPGTLPSWDDPGDGAEVDPDNRVVIYVNGKATEQILKFEEFVARYAEHFKLDKRKADDKIIERLMEAGDLEYAERDDGPEYDKYARDDRFNDHWED